jgi:hypothetical protein
MSFANLKPGTKTLGATALTCLLAITGTLHAQTDAPSLMPAALRPPVTDPALPAANPIVDPLVQQTSGCSNCNGPRLDGPNAYTCNGCNHCLPGRPPCNGCDSDTCLGRFINGVYMGLCCPDPCYEPTWIAAENAAFFQDSPRPVTQTRIRWDAVFHYGFPDTAEFFWSQIGTKGPKNPSPYVNYGGLYIYQEVAASPIASAFVEMSYLSLEPVNDPSSAGFGDLNAGVKAVIFDRELLLVTTQFRTYAPVGVFTAGLGTGHVSLEPSLLAALKLTPTTYLQMQLADWVPLGGTPGFAGMTFHYHLSLNQNLCQVGNMLNVVGTIELNGYSYRGQFTDFPSGTAVGLDGSTYLNAGPGLRVQFCDRLDFGVGMAFGFGDGHGPGQIYRTEIRLRF